MARETKQVDIKYLEKIELMNENMEDFIVGKHGCSMVSKTKDCERCFDPGGDCAVQYIRDHFSNDNN